jgi:hypothetical protein
MEEVRIKVSEKEINYVIGTSPGPLPFSPKRFELEFSIARIFHRVLNVYRLIDSQHQIFDAKDYQVLGNSLSKILFDNEGDQSKMKNFKNHLRNPLLSEDTRCRIYLEFLPDAGDVAELPWEYLKLDLETNSQEGNTEIHSVYLAADQKSRFDLIRSFPDLKIFNPPRNVQKLNVIAITASCAAPFDIGLKKFLDWCNSLEKEYPGSIKFHQLLQPKDEQALDKNGKKRHSLSIALTEILATIDGPYIIHYLGHARTSAQSPQLSFVGENDEAKWVSDEKFAKLLDVHSESKKLQNPHLVIFQACSSGRIKIISKEKFAGIGIKALMENIPAVIAMQNDVSEKDSLQFLQVFYSALINGDDIAEATTKGRTHLAYGSVSNQENSQEEEDHFSNNFGTPVLFISTTQPFAFMERKAQKENLNIEKYKYCTDCKVIFEESHNKEHQGHRLITTTREEYLSFNQVATATENAGSTPRSTTASEQSGGPTRNDAMAGKPI